MAECPKCGWHYPIILPPKRYRNGAEIECPDCKSTLILRSGKTNRMIMSISSILLLPLILLVGIFDENKVLQAALVIPTIIIFSVLTYFFYRDFSMDLKAEEASKRDDQDI